VRSESTSRLCLKNVVDKDNSCVTLNVAVSAVCTVQTQCSAIDWRFAGALLCMTDREEVVGSLGVVENALRSRQEVAMLQSVLQPRPLPE
jgi:hypothetical protein